MYRQPAWLDAMACGTLKSEVPSVRMLVDPSQLCALNRVLAVVAHPSLRRMGPAHMPGPVAGILMQKRSLVDTVSVRDRIRPPLSRALTWRCRPFQTRQHIYERVRRSRLCCMPGRASSGAGRGR